MLMIFLLIIFGLAAYRRGEFKVTRYRKVDGETARMLGVIMLVGAGLSFVIGGWIGLVALLVAIILGLLTSKPIAV